VGRTRPVRVEQRKDASCAMRCVGNARPMRKLCYEEFDFAWLPSGNRRNQLRWLVGRGVQRLKVLAIRAYVVGRAAINLIVGSSELLIDFATQRATALTIEF
jgi:hypothetical protein